MWDDDDETVFEGSIEATDAEDQLSTMTTLNPGDLPETGVMGMALQAAQKLERPQKRLVEEAKQIGELLGQKAFYRFPTGDKVVQGESIGLAEALAQVWGGILCRVYILRSDQLPSGGRRVHQRASVIDLKTLVCVEVDQIVATAAPPGKFAEKPEQRERWHAMQANSAASKILRNGICRVLPKWLRTPALNAAIKMFDGKVLGKQDGRPRTLQEARGAAIETLEQHGCHLAELETYVGLPVGMWAVAQLELLRELYTNLKSGAVAIEAWRAELKDAATETHGTETTVSKTALGLPAQTAGSETVTDKMPAKEPEPEPAKAGKASKGKKSEPQQNLPGADK